MFAKLKCIIGIHDYKSRAESNIPIDLEEFKKDPSKFFAYYTCLICQHCGYTFPKGVLNDKKIPKPSMA